MSTIAMVGWGAVAALVLGWLIISFTAPSPRRTVVEWLSACAMFVALISLFANLLLSAQASGSSVAVVAFGFLAAVFVCGLAVSLYQTFTSLGSGGSEQVSATN